MNYILDENGVPVLEPDIMKWASWMGNPNLKRSAHTNVNGLTVSTTFLGIDHNFGNAMREQADRRPPILWETMIFNTDDGRFHDFQERYDSKEEAMVRHEEIVASIRDTGEIPE
jgi:hypothetical protein